MTYKSHIRNGILGFDVTNQMGEFTLNIPSGLDTIILNITHLNYKPLLKLVYIPEYEPKFVLIEKVDFLEEITLKSPPPISRNKDTVNYIVNFFQDKNDRAIKDIIKKLPGIEMDGSTILYNNKPIQNFYINGLNMLDGRYDLANENLPAEVVSSVQIIENDQPIKILDSLVFSDRASLNLKLKKDLTLTGPLEAKIGGPPLTWVINFTPMLFQKEFQSIISYQSNNRGKKVKNQIEDLIGEDSPTFSNSKILNLVRAPPLAINSERWLDNNSNFLSFNFLKKLNNDVELKGSLSYNNENIDHKYRGDRTFFLPDRVLRLTEEVSNSSNLNSLEGHFTLSKNKEKVYINNTVIFEGETEKASGNVIANQNDVFQRNKAEFWNLHNKLDLKTFIGNKLVEINSNSYLFKVPQSLLVMSDDPYRISFPDIPVIEAEQTVNYEEFFTKNSLSFLETFSVLNFIPELGFLLKKNNFRSHLGGMFYPPENDLENENYTNSTSRLQTDAFISLKSNLLRRNFNLEITLPITFTSISMSGNQDWENKTKFIVSPSFRIKYDHNSHWVFRLGGSYEELFLDINETFDEYVLINYRRLERNNLSIRRTDRLTNYISASFKDELKGTFMDFDFNFRKEHRDYISSYNFESSTGYIREFLNIPSDASSLVLNSNIGKFFRELKTVLKLKNSISKNSSVQFLEGEKNNIAHYSYRVGLNLNINKIQWMVIDYENKLLLSAKYTDHEKIAYYQSQEHNLEISLVPHPTHVFSFYSNIVSNNFQYNTTSNFFDIQYKYKAPKWKIDFEFLFYNILNEKEYISISNTDFSVIENNTSLRPRQFLIGVSTKF